MPTPLEIRTVALDHFLVDGYRGTSLAEIADELGTSKASLLYHFPSKEAMLEAALSPALDEIEAVVERMAQRPESNRIAGVFLDEFVDMLIKHRREVHLVMNQSLSLHELPTMQRASALITRLIDLLDPELANADRRVRVGVALAGAAYLLAVAGNLHPRGPKPEMDRDALIALMRELLTPNA